MKANHGQRVAKFVESLATIDLIIIIIKSMVSTCQ